MTYRRCSSEHEDYRCVLGFGHTGPHRAEAEWPTVAVSWPNDMKPPRKQREPKAPPEQLEGQLSIYDALEEA